MFAENIVVVQGKVELIRVGAIPRFWDTAFIALNSGRLCFIYFIPHNKAVNIVRVANQLIGLIRHRNLFIEIVPVVFVESRFCAQSVNKRQLIFKRRCKLNIGIELIHETIYAIGSCHGIGVILLEAVAV